ncbi:MAG: GGIII-like transmembrane region-containing protein, partial [Thermoplasmata archaeon]|nr:LPXTG cell wall anchor domain-containing protein [Euryarchaeota archaeon]
GQSFSSTTNTITFPEPNGTYSYTIAAVNKSYSPSPSSGTFIVNGANVNVAITFTLVTYSITFTENGLPSGTTWSVTLGGITKTSNTTTIIFNEPNGTYNYSLSYPTGFVIKNGADKKIIYIEGNNVTLLVTFEKSKPNNLFTWLIILGGLLVLITIIALILFRRRKKDKESNINIEDVY